MSSVERVAVFLSNRMLSQFNWELLAELPPARKVAIVGQSELRGIPPKVARLLDEVHHVPEVGRCGILPVLDVDAAGEVIADLRARYPGARLGIICPDEGNTLEAAKLRDRFGLPGPGYEDILPFRDKSEMKRRLEPAGLRVPRHGLLDKRRFAEARAGYVDELLQQVGLPLVLKPLDSAGADGVHIVGSREELLGLRLRLPDDTYEYEEFIRGDLYHCDAVVKEGEFVFQECSRYSCGNFDFQLGKMLGSLPLEPGDPTRELLLSFAAKVLRALGNPEVASHMELFVSPEGEPVFLEVAARAPGLLIVPMYERHFGVNVLNLDYSLQLGLPFPAPARTGLKCFYGLIPSRAGTIVGLEPPKLRAEYQLDWHVSLGEVRAACKSNLDKVASVLAWAPDYALLREDFASLQAQELVRYSAD